jgi:hypothetical protein
MSTLANSLDNPLFVKHLRSRLRRPQVMPSAVVVLVICLCISYAGYELRWFTNGVAFRILLGFQSIILGIIGASRVSSAVGGARESGILDFHRVSPLSPLAVTLGFFFGAPVREYLLFALTVPFTLICAANDSPSLGDLLQTMVALFLGSWLLQALALFTALSIKKPKEVRGIIGVFIFLIVLCGMVLNAMTRGFAFLLDSWTYNFFGIPLPWLVFVLLYGLPTLFFLLLASVRKMQSERAHAFTKPEAVICLAVQALLTVGAVWSLERVRLLTLVVIYLLVAIACVLTVTITPNLGEYAKGVRRAERLGRSRLGYWDNLSLNRVALTACCAIVLAGATVAWKLVEDPRAQELNGFAMANPFGAAAPLSYSLSIAVGVLTVASVGLALQFFLLLSPKRGSTFMGLFLFMTWLIPGVIGLLASASGAGDDAALFISSLSPVVGIASSARPGPEGGSIAIQAAALSPAIVFAFLFNNLVTVQRRRALKEIHEGPGTPAKPAPVLDPLAV